MSTCYASKPKSNSFLLFITFFCCFCALGSAQSGLTLQNSYSIENNDKPDQLAFYTSAIQSAYLEIYRKRDLRVSLVFDNGFTLVLYSAKELFTKGILTNPNDYNSSSVKTSELPIFTILPNGKMTARIKAMDKAKQ